MEGHVCGCRKFPEGVGLLGQGSEEDRSIQVDLTLDMEMPTN